jgi:phenylalanyl-tRNA synthetase beta chain
MNISLNWLKQFVDLPKSVDPKDLGLKLTMSTVEVEEVIDLSKQLDNIVVGEISKISKHPNADKLQLVDVNAGAKFVRVVCGGINLKQDMLVAIALPGAKARWHGEGDWVTVEKAKVRGEASEGMICASDEIGIESIYPVKEPGEITDLSESGFTVGTPLAKALGLDDIIYDIDNKSLTNRPDLWGHYGIAREVAALYDRSLADYNLDKFTVNKEVDLKVVVEDKKLCPRYLGVVLKNVKIGPSPEWLTTYLQAIGQKSINNIVDITNYLMYELGQPLHAFSADTVKDYEIIVRRAHNKEKLVTLDEEERELTENDLVIADKDKAVALAGIMGNLNSGINENTSTVIIESANFDPVAVRRTSSRLGLRSEASMRFEKSLDPNMAETAIRRAINLIQKMMPQAEVVSNLVDQSSFKLDEGPIDLTWEFIAKRIGEEINQKTIITNLKNLGFKVKDSREGIKVYVPSWRATKDVSIREDIIEEITRIYGYDNLKPVMPAMRSEYGEQNELRKFERELKQIMALKLGCNEVYNYSFVDNRLLEKINQPVDHMELANPWDENLNLMRKNLVPNLLQNVVDNLRFENELKIFEVGKVFQKNEPGLPVKPEAKQVLPAQPLFAGSVFVSNFSPEQNFSVAKGQLETLAEKLNFKLKLQELKTACSYCHPQQSLQIQVGKEVVGYIANLHPQAAKNLDLSKTVSVWEINLEKIFANLNPINKFQALAKFPSIEIDLSIVVVDETEWQSIESIVAAINPKLIQKIELLDIFKGDKIEVGNKSVTLRITYSAKDRTLEMDEVNKLQDEVVSQLEKGVAAQVRK